jgi:uncharacterized protein (DUF2236 family)
MHEDGYFPRGSSILRQVQEERVVGLFFGQRALCIGALAPLNFIGTATHTSGRLTPFKRLARTGKHFETVFFGSKEQADRVLKGVAAQHSHVHGETPDDAGPVPAGTPYSALEPEAMLWTFAVMADSAERFYELFVRPLSRGEREGLWQDYLKFGELFGTPRDACPGNYREFRAWWEARLASDQMFLTDEARYTGYSVAFEIPMSRLRQPAKRIHDAIMLGSLPPRVRELYGLSYGPRQHLEFLAGVAAIRASRLITPARFALGSCGPDFDRVAAVERQRIERGEPTPQVHPGDFPSAAYSSNKPLPAASRRSGQVKHDLAGRAA